MEIKRGVIIFIFSYLANVSFASADFIGFDVNLPNYSIDSDLFIDDGISFNVDSLDIVSSVRIINNGSFHAGVNICSGCRVEFKNSGFIDATFNLGENASIVQVINSGDDLNSLGMNGGFDVLVNNSEIISWNAIRNVANGADKIILENSVLKLDALSPGVFNALDNDIELRGKIVIYADNVDELLGVPVLSNVYGNGVVYFHVKDINPLYAIRSYVSNDSLYAEMVRETDYMKIFNNKMGAFLNMVRTENPNSDFINALDNATSFDSVYSIIGRSVKLNPILLMKPIRIFNNFEMANISVSGTGISAAPIYLFSDVLDFMAINFNGSIKLNDNLKIGLAAYIGGFDFSDDINEYGGTMYGGNASFDYLYGIWFARGVVGATAMRTDVGIVFNNDEIVHNPGGASVYGATDVGINFIYDKFIVSPFVRAGADYAMILDDGDIDVFVGIGGDFMYDAGGTDIDYKYGVRFGADSRGLFSASVRMNVMSIADNAGGDISIGVIYDDDFDLNYNFRIGANLKF